MEHEADEEEKLILMDFIIDTSIGEGMTEGQIWYELDMEAWPKVSYGLS